MDTQVKADVLGALAEAVASALGIGWTAQPGEHREVMLLMGPDLRLEVRPNRSQLVIGPVLGELWRWAPRGAGDARIGVDARRSAAAIAGEITRRLLPKARRVLADCLQGKLDYEKHIARKWAVTRRLAEALGVNAPEAGHDPDRDAILSIYRHDDLSCRAQVCGDDIDLRISAPVDLAVRVCELVRLAMEAH